MAAAAAIKVIKSNMQPVSAAARVASEECTDSYLLRPALRHDTLDETTCSCFSDGAAGDGGKVVAGSRGVNDTVQMRAAD